ncbi:MAG: FG-GAP repeat protein [Calditrichaceae bacterium]|nr:FG-GAP-like repeat-containing protein [Calditrichia bacterium]NUQ40510.1 FG-GAP repeat protein [Calditrichaceae bacterium]
MKIQITQLAAFSRLLHLFIFAGMSLFAGEGKPVLNKIAGDDRRVNLHRIEETRQAQTAKDYPGNPGEYATAGLSLIQTFPALPPSGRNGSFLGEIVAGIGDVNGDGYDDWAVGLKYAAIYQTAEKVGKVYIYFGGGALVNEKDPDLILTGEADYDFFGFSVSGAGDVNNDGFSDVIVGAYLNDDSGFDAGRAYLYFGGATMDNIPDAILTGEASFDYFGVSVASAGDVNNDGFSDVIVGAYEHNAAGFDVGRAYIYLGGANMDNIADVVLTGEDSYHYFGASVSGAGDVNNDGFSDVIVAASPGGTLAGHAYLYLGGANMDNIADLVFHGESSTNLFTTSVSGAGDVNNDGFSDLIIGAYLGGGRASLYFGGASMDNVADLVLTGEFTVDYFGISISGAGDVNQDGYSDVLVGASAAAGGVGRAYLFRGGANMDDIPDVVFTGQGSNDQFGYSVSGVGDVNNDGFPDVIAGAYVNDAGGLNAGRAYLYFGAASMNNTADVILTGEGSGNHFGVSVSDAGDVNNDGFSDVIVGAYLDDANGIGEGRAYLYLGGPNMDNVPDVVFIGESTIDYFGISVSGAGDVNNDGFADVIVGAYANNAGGLDAGRAYLYFGGADMDNMADVIFTGEAAFDYFGISVSGAGDVNNDGFADVIIGAYLYDAGGFDAGRAYLYFGGANMDNIPDLIFDGEAIFDYFGYSVSSAGDVNNDGFADVIIGAHSNDAGGSDAGRAYLYFGGASMDNIADLIFTGEASINYFGVSVSSAGDVNNDGFSDVVVGADLGGGNTGRAYLYLGGANMNNIPDVIFNGEGSTDLFGASVSSAGDVNNDGYSDLLVGAYRNDGGALNGGRAYLYLGGANMDNIADAVFTGLSTLDYFGVSVSAAGDVNNDGFSDLIIGAEGSSAVGYEMGRAYLYAGSISVGIEDKENKIPAGYQLFQNYPNPFNPTTTIRFSLPRREHVTLKIFDLLGRKVATPVEGNLEPGEYSVVFDGSGLSSGVYFYRLEAGSFAAQKKLILVR